MAVTSPAAPAVAYTPKKLGWRQYSGYATGDAANNLAFAMASSFLLLYYTNVVGLGRGDRHHVPAGPVWDAFADLFAGRMVDAKTRGGSASSGRSSSGSRCPAPVEHGDLLGQDVLPQHHESQALIYAYISYAVWGPCTAW